MRLEVLSLDLGLSRSGGEDAQAGIKATVVPAEHDSIRLGSRHIFAGGYFRSKLERIDARLHITAHSDHLGDVWSRFPEGVRLDQEPVGYAYAHIPEAEGETATLSIVLFADETRLAQLMAQVDCIDAGAIAADVWIDGLKFGLPDEEIWESRGDYGTQFLPIRQFSIEVAKLRTTRQAIRDKRDNLLNEQLADSDEADERKMGRAWIREAAQQAAEQRIEPSLVILRHCRTLLALLLIGVAVAIVQRL